jgi:hypothetical protein
MHDVEMAGLQFLGAAAAAAHVQNFDLEALVGVEAGRLRGPPGQNGVHRIGNPGLDLDRLGGAGGRLPARHRHGERQRA